MIKINGNLETIRDLNDVSYIIRMYYNEELADQLDDLIPTYTDDDYYTLEDRISELEDEIYYLESTIEELENQ